jgi:hypothetical protein
MNETRNNTWLFRLSIRGTMMVFIATSEVHSLKTVSITLPDPIYEDLMSWARGQQRSPDEVVVEAIRAYRLEHIDSPISLFALPPLDLGPMSLVQDDDLLGEMLDDSRP